MSSVEVRSCWRSGAALGKIAARAFANLLLLERLECRARDWRGRCCGRSPASARGEPERLGHIAVGQRGDEGALGQLAIARIVAQRLAKKGRGGQRVALGAGDQRREIIARRLSPTSNGVATDRLVAQKRRAAAKTLHTDGGTTKTSRGAADASSPSPRRDGSALSKKFHVNCPNLGLKGAIEPPIAAAQPS